MDKKNTVFTFKTPCFYIKIYNLKVLYIMSKEYKKITTKQNDSDNSELMQKILEDERKEQFKSRRSGGRRN